ncbi:HNH endonuclease [Streptomyces sp. WAC 06783]|uniref:HNH endonuclease family protein n=1 Tax=Streptomyces sp. WAC 06783 TaxID=2203211 RepID=UPI000F746ECB|nr:HNH endonuclease family protein [Streptomyces sp. WAC 06783]RSO06944.1 HNH endonuclease [Streptomyces sp. WAC 06783]
MKAKRTITGLLAAATLAAATPAAAAPPQDHRRVATVRQLIAELPVTAEHRQGYQRSKFKHWVDADKDGCNTRQEVLKQEAVTPPQQTRGCKLTGGQWWSYYDDTAVNGPAGLDIDHMVPLAEAWDSGAYRWTAKRRELYANDLGYPRSLVAVTARANRSKADQDPAQWMPPAEDARCQYLDDWVSVKTRWALSVDGTEQQSLQQLSEVCPDTTMDVPIT